jgi:hypothetical protein
MRSLVADDLAARRVVLRVRGEAQLHVERQANGIAFDLDVSLLHDVEQADLHFAGEIRQLVQRKDAAIRPRQHAVVNRQLVGQHMPAARGANWIEIADQVGDGDVGCRELFDVAVLTPDPRDRRILARLVDQVARVLRDGRDWIVVDLTSGDDRQRVVHQADEPTEDPGLRLTTEPEQNKVVLRENRVRDLRHDGVFVSDQAGEQRSALAQAIDQILAKLVFDRAKCAFRDAIWRALESAEGFGMCGHVVS